MDSDFVNITAYSIDGFGALKPISYNRTTTNAKEIAFTVSGENSQSSETTIPYGVVVIFDAPPETSEPLPTTLIVTSIATAAVISLGLIVYLKKRNR
jgi:hypothetical protein